MKADRDKLHDLFAELERTGVALWSATMEPHAKRLHSHLPPKPAPMIRPSWQPRSADLPRDDLVGETKARYGNDATRIGTGLGSCAAERTRQATRCYGERHGSR
jgi:hypothetical protein